MMDLGELCRTCLSKSPTLFSIFNTHDPKMESAQYAIEFVMNFCCIPLNTNSMPNKVCQTCSEEIKRAYAFKMKCERTRNILERYMQQLEPGQKPTKRCYWGEDTATRSPPSTENCSRTISCSNSKTEATNSQVVKKKVRKKITQKRPINEIQVGVEQNSADVVCIDDGEKEDFHSTISTYKKIQETEKRSTGEEVDVDREKSNNPLPLKIAQVATSDALESVFDPNVGTKQNCEVSRADSPISIILSEDKQSASTTSTKEVQNSDPTANNENIEEMCLDVDCNDRSDVIEILDDEQPELVAENLKNDSFVCHVCMKVINGEAQFITHINSHKALTEETQIAGSAHNTVQTFGNSQAAKKIRFGEVEMPTVDCFLCHFCRKLVVGSDKYVEHVRSCRSEELRTTAVKLATGYRCGECMYVCRNKESLISHVRTLHIRSVSMFTCGICASGFSSSEELSRHITQQACLQYNCKECKNNFNNRKEYEDHIKECSGLSKINIFTIKEEYPCKYCKRIYASNYLKTKHMGYCTKRRKPRTSSAPVKPFIIKTIEANFA